MSKLNTDLSVKHGTITINTSSYPNVHWRGNVGPYLVKQGNVVSFVFGVEGITANADLSAVVEFPEGFRPSPSISPNTFIVCGVGGGWGSLAHLGVNPDGKCTIRSTSAYASFSGTFIAEN